MSRRLRVQGVEYGSTRPIAEFLWRVFDVSRCKAVDAYTVDLATYHPLGALLDHLSNPNVGYILSRQAYEEQGPEDNAGDGLLSQPSDPQHLR